MGSETLPTNSKGGKHSRAAKPPAHPTPAPPFVHKHHVPRHYITSRNSSLDELVLTISKSSEFCAQAQTLKLAPNSKQRKIFAPQLGHIDILHTNSKSHGILHRKERVHRFCKPSLGGGGGRKEGSQAWLAVPTCRRGRKLIISVEWHERADKSR